MKLPIKGKKVVRQGNSYVIRLPMSYIRNGLLSENELVDAEIEPVKNKKEKESLKNTRQSQDSGLYCSPATLSSNYPGEVLS